MRVSKGGLFGEEEWMIGEALRVSVGQGRLKENGLSTGESASHVLPEDVGEGDDGTKRSKRSLRFDRFNITVYMLHATL